MRESTQKGEVRTSQGVSSKSEDKDISRRAQSTELMLLGGCGE